MMVLVRQTFSSLDGGEDEGNSIGFMDISTLITTWDALFSETESFDGIHLSTTIILKNYADND